MNKFDRDNLITLLKIFKNRPYHLAKYLIDNSAFTDKFLEKINSSERLTEISKSSLSEPVFQSIVDMEEFYNSFVEELPKEENKEKLEKECRSKLKNLIKLEKYEEAAILRDYMIKMGIAKN